MAPKIGMDEDGDTPPCSVMHTREYAEKWDVMKQKKYNGTQKAVPTVERFKHMWDIPVPVVKPTPWWLRFFGCYCFRGPLAQRPALTSVQPFADAKRRRPGPL